MAQGDVYPNEALLCSDLHAFRPHYKVTTPWAVDVPEADRVGGGRLQTTITDVSCPMLRRLILTRNCITAKPVAARLHVRAVRGCHYCCTWQARSPHQGLTCEKFGDQTFLRGNLETVDANLVRYHVHSSLNHSA